MSEPHKQQSKCLLALKTLVRHRGHVVLFGVPLALLPLVFYIGTKEAKAAFVILTMTFYWNFEVMPVAVTALMPVILVPILDIMPSRDICPSFFNDSNMLALGCLTIAVAMESWNLDKRISLRVLLLFGIQPRWPLFGFMLAAWFLSMWISNVAVVILMLPVSETLLIEMRKHYLLERRWRSQSGGSDGSNYQVPAEASVEADPTDGATNPAIQMSTVTSFSPSGDVTSASGGHDASPQLEPAAKPQSEARDDSTDDSDGRVNNNNNSNINRSAESDDDEAIDEAHDIDTRIPMIEFVADKRNAKFASIARMLMLSIAYGALFGGVATLSVTAPNVILNGIVQQYFGSGTPLNYSNWMLYALPLSVINLLIAWVWLQISFFGFRGFIRPKKFAKRDEKRIKAMMRRQYEKLGSITYAEVTLILVLVFTAVLWISREPWVRGWSVLFLGPDPNNSGTIMSFTSDAQPPILSAILLFLLPSRNPFTCCRCRCPGKLHRCRRHSLEIAGTPNLAVTSDSKPTRMLTWKLMQVKMRWILVLMLGAASALMDITRVSGLADWFGQQLLHLEAVPMEALLFIICLLSAVFTEWTTHGTSATILLPMVANLSQKIHAHPFYLMLSCTASCSFAFILPISTPPNILAFTRGYLRAVDVLRTGSMMWLISNSLVAVATITYAPAIFGLREYPDWAWRNTSIAAAA